MKQFLMAVAIALWMSPVVTPQGGQVTICHVPPGNPAAAATIAVGPKAADAHLANHPGDHLGACEAGGSNLSVVVFSTLLGAWLTIYLVRRRRTLPS